MFFGFDITNKQFITKLTIDDWLVGIFRRASSDLFIPHNQIMDISKPSFEKEARVLTQDGSPPKKIPNKETGIGITYRTVMDHFVSPGDMSPTAAAEFVTCAIDNADKNKIGYQSPATKQLFFRHKVIGNNPQVPDSVKKHLKMVASREYVRTYNNQSRHQSVVTPQLLSDTGLVKLDEHTNRKLEFAFKQPPPQSKPKDVTESNVRLSDSIKDEVAGQKKVQTRVNWSKEPKRYTSRTMEAAKDYVKANHPSLKNMGCKNKLKVYYRCLLSEKVKGNCKGTIYQDTDQSFIVKIKFDSKCKCSDYKKVARGLQAMAKKCFNDVMKDAPEGTPKTNADVIMSMLTKESSIDTTTAESRAKIRKKVVDLMNYTKKNGSEGYKPINRLGDVINFQKKYTFHVPKEQMNQDLEKEEELQIYGSTLYKNEHLRVLFPSFVTTPEYESEAYRSMTMLDGAFDADDSSTSDAEKRLYSRIEELQKKL